MGTVLETGNESGKITHTFAMHKGFFEGFSPVKACGDSDA